MKNSNVRIVTHGGMTLIAPASRVRIYQNLGRIFAMWDMRHGLNRDTHYNRSIPFSAIDTLEYLK